ncbi:MAG: efflux transporter outer membrane subunit [Litorimonas sp.]
MGRLIDTIDNRRRAHVLAALFFGVALSGCATFDVPTRPVLPEVALASSTFQNSSLSETSRTPEAIPNWWTRFDDPELVILVERALSENRNLAVAQANVATAEAQLRRAGLFQSYNVSSTSSAELNNSIGSTNIDRNVNGALRASWEFDAFGRIENQIRAIELNRDAVVQSRRDVAVLVASETAQAYVDLRSAQARLAVAQENAALQAEGLDLLTQLVEAGRSNDLDLNRSRAQYLTTRASLPTFRAAVASTTARLTALTGTYAGDNEGELLLSEPSRAGNIPHHQGALGSSSPEALIRRRPDIRAAEARLSQRLALAEVDRARLFPTLVFNADLRGFFGSVENFPDRTFFGLGVGPALNWEGPDLRRIRADIEVTDTQTVAAFAAYEQVIFTALSEVETALALYAGEVIRRDDLTDATEAASNALKLARLRFDEGLDDFLDVLDAQRTLLDAQDDLVQNDTLITTFAISAYRALGGMWTDAELDAHALPQ